MVNPVLNNHLLPCKTNFREMRNFLFHFSDICYEWQYTDILEFQDVLHPLGLAGQGCNIQKLSPHPYILLQNLTQKFLISFILISAKSLPQHHSHPLKNWVVCTNQGHHVSPRWHWKQLDDKVDHLHVAVNNQLSILIHTI